VIKFNAAGTVSSFLIHRLRPYLFAIVPIILSVHTGAQHTAAGLSPSSGWVLTWGDEFNGPDGSPPDATKWIVESGGSGWGNNELEYYTPRSENVRVENGNLVIEAIKQRFVGTDGVQRDYTSARLKSEGHFSQRYGRFEARIQIPSGQGAWPAFWMLGDDYHSAGWPTCGEIDIMESIGSRSATIQGSLHGPGYSGSNPLTSAYTLPRGRFSDRFHVFAVEWEPQVIRFYVDDRLYATKTPADLSGGKRWVYDHAFFILLNLAVGGTLPGKPGDSTVFPQRMLVDYVRVYTRK
jgi:beta-glucanase (GH16 family)